MSRAHTYSAPHGARRASFVMRIAVQLIGVLSLLSLVQPNVDNRDSATSPPPMMAESFDGLGVGFTGPQGSATLRNPGLRQLYHRRPDHIVQTVNSRMAIVHEAEANASPPPGRCSTGRQHRRRLRGFGGACEERNNGDAVVRYRPARRPVADRHANLLARRGPARPAAVWTASPTSPTRAHPAPKPTRRRRGASQPPAPRRTSTCRRTRTWAPQAPLAPAAKGPYSMCYAVGTLKRPPGPYFPIRVLATAVPRLPSSPRCGPTATTCLRAPATK